MRLRDRTLVFPRGRSPRVVPVAASMLVLTSLVSPQAVAAETPASAAAGASPAPTEEARSRALALFKESAAAYREGRFAEALRLLEEAYALRPEPVLVYNMARAHERMGQLDASLSAYERYLREAGPATTDETTEVRRHVDELRRQIAERDARANPRAQPDGSAAQGPKPIAAQGDGPSTSAPIAPWVVAGLGVATLGAGTVFGIVARGKERDARSEPVHATAVATLDDARRFATGANVAFVVGGVLAAGGVAWGVATWPTRGPAAAPKPRVGVDAGPGGLGVRGTF